MTHRPLRYDFVLCICLLLLGANTLCADTGRPQAARTAAVASPEKIVQYMRDRFGVPESVQVTAEPLSASPSAQFLQTTVTTDDGKQKRSNNVFISNDGRCFVMGSLFALREGSTDELIHCIREAAKVYAGGAAIKGTKVARSFERCSADTLACTAVESRARRD